MFDGGAVRIDLDGHKIAEWTVEDSDVRELHGLDEGIGDAVRVLRRAGIETFESCQGGAGHCYPEPTVRFHGHRDEGFRALAVALLGGLEVRALRRTWPIYDGEPTGPYWEMTFAAEERTDAPRGK